jgi:hypothetical protein
VPPEHLSPAQHAPSLEQGKPSGQHVHNPEEQMSEQQSDDWRQDWSTPLHPPDGEKEPFLRAPEEQATSKLAAQAITP